MGELETALGITGLAGFALSVVNWVERRLEKQEHLEVDYGWDLDEETLVDWVIVSVANRGSETTHLESAWFEDANGKRLLVYPKHGSISSERHSLVPGDRVPFLLPHDVLREKREYGGYVEFVRVGARSTRSRKRRFRRDSGVYGTDIPAKFRSYF